MKHSLLWVIAILIIFCLIGLYLDALLREQIIRVALILLYVIACLVLVTLIGLLLFSGLIFRERWLKERAGRQLAEREAQVMVITAREGDQIYIRDLANAPWRNAHLDTRVYAPGPATAPSPTEITAWQTYQLRHRAKTLEAAQTPVLAPPTPVDLLTALDQAQCALIVGQREAGKTTLLQHLIRRRLASSRVVVLDPHSHPKRWPAGSTVIGTERNFPHIERALVGLEALMGKRYRDIGRGLVREGEHPSITVVVDEWRAIVFNLGKPAGNIIKTLLAESRKTNIDVFVGTHSERVKALGIEGEGDLKEGFVMVRLNINKLTKERQATIDYGDGETIANLPGRYVNHSSEELADKNFLALKAEPGPEEAKILAMHRAGESLRSISKEVYDGKFGEFYNQKIKAVLHKYGEQ